MFVDSVTVSCFLLNKEHTLRTQIRIMCVSKAKNRGVFSEMGSSHEQSGVNTPEVQPS